MFGSGGERKLAGRPTVCARARKTVRGTSSVNSFLISRGLTTGIVLPKNILPFGAEMAFLRKKACIL